MKTSSSLCFFLDTQDFTDLQKYFAFFVVSRNIKTFPTLFLKELSVQSCSRLLWLFHKIWSEGWRPLPWNLWSFLLFKRENSNSVFFWKSQKWPNLIRLSWPHLAMWGCEFYVQRRILLSSACPKKFRIMRLVVGRDRASCVRWIYINGWDLFKSAELPITI